LDPPPPPPPPPYICLPYLFTSRLVAVLAELGQKGGVLRFVGKIALLWGGIRGAMSLTDRLISFLRISERPLFQRLTLIYLLSLCIFYG
jgi:uncharacterized protein